MAHTSLIARDPEGLRSAIDAAGLGIADIAQTAGVTRQFLWLLLSGKRRCVPTVATAITAALDAPVGRFFGSPMFDLSYNNQEDCMPATAVLDDPYLNFEDVADLARMSPSSLRHLRNAGKGPEFKKVGKRLKITRSKAVAWIEAYGDDAE